MTDQEFDNLKELYIDNIKKFLTESGGMFPHISLFAEDKEDITQKNAIIHVPIPDDLMKSDGGKDYFIEKAVPDIAKKVNEKFIVKGVCWASEAWMRHADKDYDFNKNNYKDLPKKEVLIVTFESATKNEVSIYEMIREGLKVTEEGDMVDNIDLKELTDIKQENGTDGGRFTGLYKKFVSVDNS